MPDCRRLVSDTLNQRSLCSCVVLWSSSLITIIFGSAVLWYLICTVLGFLSLKKYLNWLTKSPFLRKPICTVLALIVISNVAVYMTCISFSLQVIKFQLVDASFDRSFIVKSWFLMNSTRIWSETIDHLQNCEQNTWVIVFYGFGYKLYSNNLVSFAR